MELHSDSMLALAEKLRRERQAQGLSREQLAAVCNVSTSFIRDAETNPERCSFGMLLQLAQGLGLRISLDGLHRLPKSAMQQILDDQKWQQELLLKSAAMSTVESAAQRLASMQGAVMNEQLASDLLKASQYEQTTKLQDLIQQFKP